MRKRERRTYQTAAELERRVAESEQVVAALEGAEKQAAMMELSKLRIYAEAKRWLERD
jgi:hypothetical protein